MSEQEIAAALRQAIQDSGESLTAIAKASGVSQPQLSRFMTGERSLTLESADKLFAHFGLKVGGPTLPKKPKGKK